MGLDMHIERVKSVYTMPEATKEEPYKGNYRIVETRDQVGYFRKFNALHHHIITVLADGVDHCQSIHLSKTFIEGLVDNFQRIKKDNGLAPSLLPTQEGFFFGSTDYDEWYFENVNEAIKIFKKILKETDFENFDIQYVASW